MKTIYIERNNLFKNINMVMCNNITNIDEDFIEFNTDLFSEPCEACEGDNQNCEECNGEGCHDLEPYQYFLCDLDKWQNDRLTSYGVKVGYSEKLGLDVIAIYDFGTSWSAFSYSKEVEDDYTLSDDETLKRVTVY